MLGTATPPPKVIGAIDDPYAVIISRAAHTPEQTEFYSKDADTLQCGRVVRESGEIIKRHSHLPIERRLTRTSEVLIVEHGHAMLSIYDADDKLVETVSIMEGDIAVLFHGGRGILAKDRLVLIEVKQGPYFGGSEKRFF